MYQPSASPVANRGVARWLLAAALLAAMFAAYGSDYAPGAQAVTDGVYAIIGPTSGRTYENHGLNNNLGFVVTGHGVVLIDSGASRQGARLVESAVAAVTGQPIRWVVNTGSQDHRWLGNDYFRKRGARIIALERTVRTQREFADRHLESLGRVLKDRLADTVPAFAEEPIAADSKLLQLGGVELELAWPGDAHFPGDAVVWLPRQKVLFSGDLIYVDRMLGVHPWSNVSAWRQAFRNTERLSPEFIVPGHGSVCDAAKARRHTGDYLDWLVDNVGAAVDEWEPIASVVQRLAEAPEFSHLEHFDDWHRTNINRTYLHLENL